MRNDLTPEEQTEIEAAVSVVRRGRLLLQVTPPDLLERLHLAQTAPTAGGEPLVSRESLRADLAGAQARANRLQSRVLQLEKRISELLGEQVWRESGLSAGADIDDLQQRVAVLEHEVADLNRTVEERTQELTAARAANDSGDEEGGDQRPVRATVVRRPWPAGPRGLPGSG